MNLLNSIKRLGEFGIRKEYKPWEKYLTRMLNYMAWASVVALSLGVLLYVAFNSYDFVYIHIIAIVVFPLIVLLNVKLGYKGGLYAYFVIVLGLMVLFFHSMGSGSRAYLFIVPFLIGLLMIWNRTELKREVVILSGIFLVFIAVCVFGYFHGWFISTLSPNVLMIMRIINTTFSSAMTLAVTFIIVKQNLRQENELTELVKEKEMLLAEVHHRVKNNMAIISSLLNLRLEETESPETKEALEDTKNKIYSMALIHKKVYSGKSMHDVDFHEYISELAGELVQLYARNRDIKLEVDAHDCTLQLDTAIPCGFIINELITNSCKYAYQNGKELELKVNMKHSGNSFDLKVTDNGPCFDLALLKAKNTLGMNLIDMLNKQLDATYTFRKDNGLVYEMKFAI